MLYPGNKNIKDCHKGPKLGGLPIAELKEVAKSMGIDITGLKKVEICNKIKELDAPPPKPVENIPKTAAKKIQVKRKIVVRKNVG